MSCLNHGNATKQKNTEGETWRRAKREIMWEKLFFQDWVNCEGIIWHCVRWWHHSHLLLLSFLGKVAFLQAHSSEEVSEVPEQGDDAKAHVGADSHIHGRLFKRLLFVLPGGRADAGAELLLSKRHVTSLGEATKGNRICRAQRKQML